MTSTHLDELARLLGGQASARTSAHLPPLREDPTVPVDGYGELQLPLRAARAKRLVTFGEPAPFGKGEDTLLDTAVRLTWHFPDATSRWMSGRSPRTDAATSTLARHARAAVTHASRRQGRPFVLVLTKTSEVFDREDHARAQAARDLRRIQEV